jgi:hypothetical protein
MVKSLAARPRRRRRHIGRCDASTARAKPTSSINGVARNSSRSADLISARRRASAARAAAFSIYSASFDAIHSGGRTRSARAPAKARRRVAAAVESRREGRLDGAPTSRLRVRNQAFAKMRRSAAPVRARQRQREALQLQ